LHADRLERGLPSVSILALDAHGTPRRWLDVEQAATCYSREQVAWDLGDFEFVLRGGVNRLTGLRSVLTLRSIVAIRSDPRRRPAAPAEPALSREMLFLRDRYLCAYCGLSYRFQELSAEHVLPRSIGGQTRWTNLVTACRPCNLRKGHRTPEQAGMPLRYVPYVPNLYEAFILRNRRILADQMAFLMSGVPSGSRLRGGPQSGPASSSRRA
jgi:hypothetical protein